LARRRFPYRVDVVVRMEEFTFRRATIGAMGKMMLVFSSAPKKDLS